MADKKQLEAEKALLTVGREDYVSTNPKLVTARGTHGRPRTMALTWNGRRKGTRLTPFIGENLVHFKSFGLKATNLEIAIRGRLPIIKLVSSDNGSY